MSKFIGREKEVELLQKAFFSDKSELIAVYGRRRIGKTFLVRETYTKNIILEISGIYKGSFKNQLSNFHYEIEKRSKRFSKSEIPSNWITGFNLLKDYIDSLKGDAKKVIFIDEFPWICTHKSNFISFFAHFWNSYCTKRKDLVVVVCGSAASFMVNKVIRNKGGLHNRISIPIRLLPFNLYETELFLKSRRVNLNRYDYLQLYMAIGGVPHYLEKINPGDSVPVAINRLCFESGGVLVNEFNEVFASLFDSSQHHIKVVETLSSMRKGMNREELLKRSGLSSGGTFTKVIVELMESGFISEYQPLNRIVKDKTYRLSDEYSLFYLKFIQANSNGSWDKLYTSRSYSSWSGFAFESICLKHLEQIKKGLGLSGIYAQGSSWSNKKAQIDLLIDRADRCVNICEMKFSNKPFTITKEYADNLINKKQEFINEQTSQKNIFLTMITTFGINANSHSDAIISNEIKMDSLFEKL